MFFSCSSCYPCPSNVCLNFWVPLLFVLLLREESIQMAWPERCIPTAGKKPAMHQVESRWRTKTGRWYQMEWPVLHVASSDPWKNKQRNFKRIFFYFLSIFELKSAPFICNNFSVRFSSCSTVRGTCIDHNSFLIHLVIFYHCVCVCPNPLSEASIVLLLGCLV